MTCAISDFNLAGRVFRQFLTSVLLAKFDHFTLSFVFALSIHIFSYITVPRSSFKDSNFMIILQDSKLK